MTPLWCFKKKALFLLPSDYSDLQQQTCITFVLEKKKGGGEVSEENMDILKKKWKHHHINRTLVIIPEYAGSPGEHDTGKVSWSHGTNPILMGHAEVSWHFMPWFPTRSMYSSLGHWLWNFSKPQNPLLKRFLGSMSWKDQHREWPFPWNVHFLPDLAGSLACGYVQGLWGCSPTSCCAPQEAACPSRSTSKMGIKIAPTSWSWWEDKTK